MCDNVNRITKSAKLRTNVFVWQNYQYYQNDVYDNYGCKSLTFLSQ